MDLIIMEVASMKRIIALILATLLIFSFASCNSDTETDVEKETDKTTENNGGENMMSSGIMLTDAFSFEAHDDGYKIKTEVTFKRISELDEAYVTKTSDYTYVSLNAPEI